MTRLGSAEEAVLAGTFRAGEPPALEWPATSRAFGDVRCAVAGEVYNLRELEEELGLGTDDPEHVLASAFERLGEALFGRLRGCFVLLVWDERRREGFLVRDQLGAGRSLYFHASGSKLYFATETRDLLRLLPSTPAPDRTSLVRWCAGESVAVEATLYERVRRLPGGRLLELKEPWAERTYWRPQYRRPLRLGRGELVDALWEALVRAVGVRAPAGETVGIVLSGGVDSSAVATAAAAHAIGYSAVFPNDERVDESEAINLLSESIGLPCTQVAIEPTGGVAVVLAYLERWGQPLVGPGYLMELPLAERAALDGASALLDGQGGDELFGLSPYYLADLVRRGRLVASLRAARRLPNAARLSAWASVRWHWPEYAIRGAIPHRLHDSLRRTRDPRRHAPAWLSPEGARLVFDAHDPWLWKTAGPGPTWWRYKSTLVTRGRDEVGASEYIHHRCAAAGLHARPPLLDVDLVDFVLRIPPAALLDPAVDRPLLRVALASRGVPRRARKSDLSPFYYDLLTTSDLPVVQRLLRTPHEAIAPYLDFDHVRTLVNRPPPLPTGTRSYLPMIWPLLTAQMWLLFLDDRARLEELVSGATPRASRVHHAPAVHTFFQPSSPRS